MSWLDKYVDLSALNLKELLENNEKLCRQRQDLIAQVQKLKLDLAESTRLLDQERAKTQRLLDKLKQPLNK